jgi:hypothetical protein
MKGRQTREQRLAAAVVSDIGNRDAEEGNVRAALLEHELANVAADKGQWCEELESYRSTKAEPARLRLQAMIEASLKADQGLRERVWFVETARECMSPMSMNPRTAGAGRPERPTKIGLAAYLVGTAMCLLVYFFFAHRSSGRQDFVKAAGFLVFSVLPGWLYLRFINIKAAQVRDDYVLALHRLGVDDPENLPEPPRASSYHSDWVDRDGPLNTAHGTIYMDKFNALFGRRRNGNHRGRGRSACLVSLLPVGVVSVICALGWGAILLDPAFLTGLAEPSAADAMRFGFLGAYAFVIQMLLRRYLQQDLKPGTYVSAAVRFLIVFILSFVLYTAWPGTPTEAMLATTFIVGFFPIVGMQFLRGVVSATLHRAVPSLQARYPLSQLDGLSVWYEAQLLEVGIEDMQNLLTANVVEIILNTRVPIGRLVDWIDQAALLVHLPTGKEDGADARPILRRAGVRCATDLEAVFPPREQSGACPSGDDLEPDENKQLRTRMTSVLDPNEPRPSTVLALLKAFQFEPNLILVRNWRHDWRDACRHGTAGEAAAHTGSRPPLIPAPDAEDEAA